MAIEAFAERARRELQATGETARKRTVATRHALTPRDPDRAAARPVERGDRQPVIDQRAHGEIPPGQRLRRAGLNFRAELDGFYPAIRPGPDRSPQGSRHPGRPGRGWPLRPYGRMRTRPAAHDTWWAAAPCRHSSPAAGFRTIDGCPSVVPPPMRDTAMTETTTTGPRPAEPRAATEDATIRPFHAASPTRTWSGCASRSQGTGPAAGRTPNLHHQGVINVDGY
jgi:hypothetical protein